MSALCGSLLAQGYGVGHGAWDLEKVLIWVVVICALVGIAIAACQYFGVVVPPVIWRIIAIVVVAAVAILAIKFLLAL